MTTLDATATDRPAETTTAVQPPPVAPGTIQLWTDLLCPFAHVAVHRLRETRERLGLGGQVRLDHHVFPLELFNGPHPRRGTDTEAVGLGQVAPEAGFRVWTGRGARRSPRAPSGSPTRTATCCTVSISSSARASGWPSSAPAGPGSRRSGACSPGSTRRAPGRSP